MGAPIAGFSVFAVAAVLSYPVLSFLCEGLAEFTHHFVQGEGPAEPFTHSAAQARGACRGVPRSVRTSSSGSAAPGTALGGPESHPRGLADRQLRGAFERGVRLRVGVGEVIGDLSSLHQHIQRHDRRPGRGMPKWTLVKWGGLGRVGTGQDRTVRPCHPAGCRARRAGRDAVGRGARVRYVTRSSPKTSAVRSGTGSAMSTGRLPTGMRPCHRPPPAARRVRRRRLRRRRCRPDTTDRSAGTATRRSESLAARCGARVAEAAMVVDRPDPRPPDRNEIAGVADLRATTGHVGVRSLSRSGRRADRATAAPVSLGQIFVFSRTHAPICAMAASVSGIRPAP